MPPHGTTLAAVKIKKVLKEDPLEQGTHQRNENSRFGFIESVHVQ